MSSALPRVPQSFFLLHPSLVTFGLEDHSESFIVRDVGNQTCARIISCLVSIPIYPYFDRLGRGSGLQFIYLKATYNAIVLCKEFQCYQLRWGKLNVA